METGHFEFNENIDIHFNDQLVGTACNIQYNVHHIVSRFGSPNPNDPYTYSSTYVNGTIDIDVMDKEFFHKYVKYDQKDYINIDIEIVLGDKTIWMRDSRLYITYDENNKMIRPFRFTAYSLRKIENA